MSTLQKIGTRPRLIPYCFNSTEEAHAAETAVNNRFDFGDYAAYATARVLYVPEHRSRLMCMSIEGYVKSLGGCTHDN